MRLNFHSKYQSSYVFSECRTLQGLEAATKRLAGNIFQRDKCMQYFKFLHMLTLLLLLCIAICDIVRKIFQYFISSLVINI